MFNPLVDSFNELTDLEIDQKISELSRKYYQTHNPQVQMQIATLLDMYKQEMLSRRARQRIEQQNQDNGENDLDSLIKVS
jgi:hypothetical protein